MRIGQAENRQDYDSEEPEMEHADDPKEAEAKKSLRHVISLDLIKAHVTPFQKRS